MRQLSLILMVIIIMSLSGCSKKKQSQKPAYMTEQDAIEEQNLLGFKAELRLPANKKFDDLLTFTDSNKLFSLQYSKTFYVEEKQPTSAEYLARYLFKETRQRENPTASYIEASVLEGNLASNLEKMETKMEVNNKEQITVNNIVGVSLVGTEPGLKVVILPLSDKTLVIKNKSLNLMSEFEGIVGSIKYR